MAVLTSAIDTEGNLPEELTAQLTADVSAQGARADHASATPSAARATPGQMGAAALFSPLASIANMLVRNPMAPVRIEAIDCEVEIEPGRQGRGDRVGPARSRTPSSRARTSRRS